MNEDIKTLTDRQLLAEIEYYQEHIIVLCIQIEADSRFLFIDMKFNSIRRVEDLKLAVDRLYNLHEAAVIRNLKI